MRPCHPGGGQGAYQEPGDCLSLQSQSGELRVLVDESGFRRRFTGAEGATRLAQRRTAWERLLRDEGVEPLFVDLAEPPDPAALPAGSTMAAR